MQRAGTVDSHAELSAPLVETAESAGIRPSPFEALASSYDETFTRTCIGTRMRRAVWRRLDAAFLPGDRVLELGCGTGEDAVHLAGRGVLVLATDPAEGMLAQARAKAGRAGLQDRVTARMLDAGRLDETDLGGPFDGAFSNFGALNCVPDLDAVSAGLSRHVRPGGRVLLCLMGRYVPWEWGWFLAHGDRRAAFRRLARGGTEWRGLRVAYPPVRQLRRVFAPGFRFLGARAIGALVPPSYAEEWAARHPRLLAALDAVERRVEGIPPFPSAADHVLVELERRRAAAKRGPLLPRRDPIERVPVLILFPHERCNCRCLMCDIWKTTGRNQLSPEEVRSWSAEWRRLGVRRVVLSGGEPLLHPGFVVLCEALRDAGLRTTLLSTGLLLESKAEDVARLVDDVIVSLDGPREIHDAIRRVPGAFDRLARGVRALEAAAPSLPVSARSTVQRANARHLRGTVAAAREIGLDGISFLAADVAPGAFGRDTSWAEGEGSSVAVGPEDLPFLAAEIDALERDCAAQLASGFIAESAERLRARVLGHFAAHAGQGDFAPLTCNAPWVSAVIEADGTVRPCFFHPPVGNVRTEGSLEAVLNSPTALSFRASLDVATNTVCRRCVCNLNLREGELDGPPARRGRADTAAVAAAGEPGKDTPRVR